jgi:hypothetical protein
VRFERCPGPLGVVQFVDRGVDLFLVEGHSRFGDALPDQPASGAAGEADHHGHRPVSRQIGSAEGVDAAFQGRFGE